MLPFGREELDYIARLDVKADIALLRRELPSIREESLRMLEVGGRGGLAGPWGWGWGGAGGGSVAHSCCIQQEGLAAKELLGSKHTGVSAAVWGLGSKAVGVGG